MATNRITATEFVPGTAPTSPGEISIVPGQLVSILIPCCGAATCADYVAGDPFVPSTHTHRIME